MDGELNNAAISEVELVCQALALALVNDPFYLAITIESVGLEQRLKTLAAYFELAYHESVGAGEVQLAAPNGGAFWLTHDQGSASLEALSYRRKHGIRRLIGARGFDCYNEICQAMDRQLPDEVRSAWYLSILGVRPEAQGAGLAGQLLIPTLAKADIAGTLSYLETFNPRSIPFYERHGFRTKALRFEPLTQREYWIMAREPFSLTGL